MPSHPARKLTPSALALVAIAVLGAFSTMHMRLVKSFPAEDQVVIESPQQIQLWFSQEPEVALTKVRLMGPNEVRFNVAKAQATDDAKSLTLAITDSLPEGAYTITWQTAAADGHKVSGEYGFTYSAIGRRRYAL